MSSFTEGSGGLGPVNVGAYWTTLPMNPSTPFNSSGVAIRTISETPVILTIILEISKGGSTFLVMATIHHPRTDADEKHAILLILRAELGRHHIHRRLGHGVQRANLDIETIRPIQIRRAAGDVDGFLDLALEEEREEEVVEMDVANGVDFEELQGDLLHLLGLLASVRRTLVILYNFASKAAEEERHTMPRWGRRRRRATASRRWKRGSRCSRR